MSTTLQPVLHALGYKDARQQRALVRLLHASGAYGALPEISGVADDRQAQAILEHVPFDNAQHAAEWLHARTQAHMFRPRGDCEDSEHFQRHRPELLAALREAGLLSAAQPARKHYKHALVLGAMQETVDERLESLKQLWEQGVRFDNIYLLGSDRPLDPAHENGANAAHEMDMMVERYKAKRADWPEAMRKLPVFMVNTLRYADGSLANTRDTAHAWLKAAKPEPGSVLAISSQPHVRYQDAAVKSVLPAGFEVETVGAPAAEAHVKISVALDALAKQIDAGFPQLLEALKQLKPAESLPIEMLDLAEIKNAPHIYQFRSHIDECGVTEGHERDPWDPILHSAPIMVHELRNGEKYVFEGFHRYDRMVRANAEGAGPQQVPAIVLREAEGVTAQDARRIGMLKNVIEQRKTLAQDPVRFVDAVHGIQELNAAAIDEKLYPKIPDCPEIREVVEAANLSEESLKRVTEGGVPVQMAIDVARRAPRDHKQQNTIMEIIEKKLRADGAHPQGGFAAKVRGGDNAAVRQI